nr:nucleotide-binding alpha-beta plait domain-containing protein [Tanacetum cinerariifolium]
MTPIPDIPNPIHLNTFVPSHLLKPEEQQKSVQEFTDQLFATTFSKFSPTPPKEPKPHRDFVKGKEVAIVEEQVNELVSYQGEGGSIPKMPKIKSFITLEGILSQEEYINQIKKIKRLSDLKAKKEKSKQEPRKMFNQATLKAQAEKWTEHEAKKAKMMEEYNHHISFRADPLPITKISYVVDSNKEATMKITRGDNPLNLIVHPNFRLRTLAGGMHKNLIPPLGVMPIQGLVINEPESGIFFMNGNTDIAFQRENEFYLFPTTELIRIHNQIKVGSEIAIDSEVMKGLSECKASESNIRRIRVKGIINEVEDHLKTYSSAGMDIIIMVTMGNLRSKEDDVQNISTSVFVTNFSDQFGAKDLWHSCKAYGHVVDAYIPDRRSKASKRFGFVRFIKVFDVDRLISNLCTIWVGRFKLHANVARFLREPMNKQKDKVNANGISKVNVVSRKNRDGSKWSVNSYAHAVTGYQGNKEPMDNTPTMVLDETCLNNEVYSLSLLGKVKEFASLTNLKLVLAKEGFSSIEIKYIGGYWVMIVFQDEEIGSSLMSPWVLGSH